MQRQRMHRTLQLLLQYLVEPLVALHLAQSAKRFRHYHQLEMRVGTRPRMLMALVLQLQQYRLQLGVDFLFDGGSNSHGDTNK